MLQEHSTEHVEAAAALGMLRWRCGRGGRSLSPSDCLAGRRRFPNLDVNDSPHHRTQPSSCIPKQLIRSFSSRSVLLKSSEAGVSGGGGKTDVLGGKLHFWPLLEQAAPKAHTTYISTLARLST